MQRFAIVFLCLLPLAACTASDKGTSDGAGAPPGSAAGGGQAATSAAAKAAVRRVVTRFGTKLKDVSTLAPPDAIRRAVRESYTGLVTPKLLQSWLADPASAPGHDVSSPWPENIEIAQVRCASADSCKVKGSIRYITSVEVANGGTADRRAVSLSLRRTQDGWRIDGIKIEARGSGP